MKFGKAAFVHSCGGATITDVGNDPGVVGLVYIAAHALDEGDHPKEAAALIEQAAQHAQD